MNRVNDSSAFLFFLFFAFNGALPVSINNSIQRPRLILSSLFLQDTLSDPGRRGVLPSNDHPFRPPDETTQEELWSGLVQWRLNNRLFSSRLMIPLQEARGNQSVMLSGRAPNE